MLVSIFQVARDKVVAYTPADLMILNHANVLKPKPNPHLFPPPRRAGEDEGGGTLTLDAPGGEKVFRLRNYGSK